MKKGLPLFTAVLLLIGCERAQFDDEITRTHGLPDKNAEYQKLLTQKAVNLKDDELYNRVLTLWDTPYRELRLPTSIGKAHIIVSGPADGKPLFLLHGMNADATMWYPNVKALSNNYRVYAIDDILGQGQSTLGDVNPSIDNLTT
ncbi:hypothetical protein RS130_22430 [Paraglaciecola aquimarina]|uniref:Uncharacterized protein n=1 Tax=Paraglaciecola aquimarina TaxID=1235557 RepID=A0ABU3T240_9ALTE|nr:hypothetical protein [Paraglaciecola aquimarina]MDU0356273.1 hypothetical protein [Paraglaciecola aquimarina]